MRISPINLSVLLVLVSFLITPAGTAAIPITAERQLQEQSPEKLQIKIERVTSTEKSGWFHFTVRAKVISVKETKSGLKKGDVLEVNYTHPNLDKIEVAGAWASPVKEGQEYKAFLKKNGSDDKKTYEPAALSGSFEKIEKP